MMKRLAIALTAIVMLAACSSKKQATSATTAATSEVSEMVSRVKAAQPKAADLSAKCSYKATIKGKTVSLSGSLKMQRDRMIQMSVTFLGIEAVRVEFEPTQMTIINRLNKTYVRGEYANVSFAKQNNLSFEAVQAMFWGELFSLGDDYRYTSTGSAGGILASSSKDVTASFMVSAAGALKQTVLSRRSNTEQAMTMTYAARQEAVPTQMTMATTGLDKDMTVAFTLSNLKLDTGLSLTPTQPGNSYKRMSAADAIDSFNF